MTNRRIAAGAVALGLVLPGLVARGQQRPARLGWLSGTNPRSSSYFVAFERRLKELGHVDGKNLIVDCAFAEGKVELLAPLAREPVRQLQACERIRHQDSTIGSGARDPENRVKAAAGSNPPSPQFPTP